MANKRAKTKYNKTELKAFEKMIKAKLVEGNEQLNFYLESIENFGKDDTDGDDTARIKGLGEGIAPIEKARLNMLARNQAKYLKHLENALLRIENGVYGICRETGNLISEERLKAVPHATLSITAKEKK